MGDPWSKETNDKVVERLTAESKADKIRLADMEATCEFLHETEADNERLQARVDELEGALQKIRTEPGDARDCRYIAGQALAATEQEKGE